MIIGITINKSWNIYNFRKGLVKTLLDEGHTVIAIAPKDKYSPILESWGCVFEHLEISSTGSNPIKEFGLITGLRRLIKKHTIDVLLTYTIKCNVYGSFAARWANIPVICNITGLGTAYLEKGVVNLIARNLYRVAFKMADFIFLQNVDDRELFLKEVTVDLGKTELLPGSGISLQDFLPQPYKPRKNPVFLMISRLLVDKGVEEYFEAAVRIKEEYPDSKLIIVGGLDVQHRRSVDSNLLKSMIEKGIIDHFPHSDEIKKFISDSDVIVLPSYREGTPRTLLEGAAMGRPLISTNVPGCKEVIKDQYNGFLCEVQNSESLYLAMKRFIQLPREDKIRFAHNSRELVERKFDESIVVNKYLARIHLMANELT